MTAFFVLAGSIEPAMADTAGFWSASSGFSSIQMVLLPIVCLVMAVLMIQARNRTKQLEANEACHRVLAEYGSEIVLRVNLDGRVLYASPAICESLGWLPEELIGEDCANLVHVEDRLPFDVASRQLGRHTEGLSFTHRLRRRNGAHAWFESRSHIICDPISNEPTEVIIVSQDVTRQRRAESALESATTKLRTLTRTDPLTALPNRRWFDDTVSTELMRASRSALPVSLLLVDIDQMRRFNDRFGYEAGDECLRSVATVVDLQGRRPGDFAGRYKGDCFGVVLPDTDIAGAVLLAERIRVGVRDLAIAAGESTDDTSSIVAVSVGVACVDPGRSGYPDRLAAIAERALQNAKRAGRNTVRVAPILADEKAGEGHHPSLPPFVRS